MTSHEYLINKMTSHECFFENFHLSNTFVVQIRTTTASPPVRRPLRDQPEPEVALTKEEPETHFFAQLPVKTLSHVQTLYSLEETVTSSSCAGKDSNQRCSTWVELLRSKFMRSTQKLSFRSTHFD